MSPSQIESRLQSLERKNRLLTRALIATIAMLAVGVFAGASMYSSSVVRTQKLEITDRCGNVVATLASDRYGAPWLKMNYQNGSANLGVSSQQIAQCFLTSSGGDYHADARMVASNDTGSTMSVRHSDRNAEAPGSTEISQDFRQGSRKAFVRVRDENGADRVILGYFSGSWRTELP